MTQIPDDPILCSMERTGYPPWMLPDPPDESEDDLSPWPAILENLEAYGNPAGPCLYELPPKGASTHV